MTIARFGADEQMPMSSTTFGWRILLIIVTSVRNSFSASSLMLWSLSTLTATTVACGRALCVSETAASARNARKDHSCPPLAAEDLAKRAPPDALPLAQLVKRDLLRIDASAEEANARGVHCCAAEPLTRSSLSIMAPRAAFC